MGRKSEILIFSFATILILKITDQSTHSLQSICLV